MAQEIQHWLDKRAFLTPDKPAMEMENGQILTFKQIQAQSQQLAKKMAGLHISKGDHVAILSPNDPYMIITIHALSYLGAVAVLLNTRLTPSELQFQLDDADVKALFFHKQQRAAALELKSTVSHSFEEITQLKEYNAILRHEIHLDEPFTIIYTSGTTGFPKGVVHTYGNHWWSAIGSALNLGLSDEDKWLAVLPYFHVGGLSIFLKSIIYGMCVYVMEKFSAERVHDAIMNKHITMISVVTTMVQRLLNQLGDDHYPESLRCMLLGGGPAASQLLKKSQEKHLPIVQSYGMTETSSQIVTLSFTDALKKIGSSGKSLFPAQVKINGQDEANAIGEIFVKGAMVSNGYYKRDEANQKSFVDGWLATGDLGYLDEEGFLYVVERRNDLIISGGENIYPTEVENAIASLTGVTEVGVIGKPSEQWGEVPVAFVVLEGSAQISADQIQTNLRQCLAAYKIPSDIRFVKVLPRNASNKLQRHLLKNWL